MAKIRKITRNGRTIYRVEICARGFRKSKTFETKIEAKLWHDEARKEASGRMIYGKTLGDALNRYEKEISPTKKTQRWDAIHIRKLNKNWISSIQIQDIQGSDLMRWAAESGLSPASINRELNLVFSVIKAARMQWKWLYHYPEKDVVRPNNPPPRDRRISEEEIKKILS